MIRTDLYNAVQTIGEPRARHFAYFDINGQTVRIMSATVETIENLRSFFYPYIASQDGTYSTDSFHDLAVFFEPELYDYIEANIPESPDEILTTALTHDSEYHLKCYSSESGEITIIEDEPLKLFYVASAGGRATKVIATVGSRIQTGLLRIIRSAWMLGHHALIVHGCVLAKEGRGMIVAGEKHAGKSTSLLNLCSKKNYDVVANDRLLLELNPSDQRLRAIGIPTVVKLRWNTVKPFPELQHLINLPLFGVYDLAKALNVKVKREVEVTAVAFLSYDEGCSKPVFRSLSQEESIQMLASHLFSRSEYEWVRKLGIGEFAPDGVGVDQTDILKGVSCFQLSSNETQLEDLAVLLDNWCQLRSTPS